LEFYYLKYKNKMSYGYDSFRDPIGPTSAPMFAQEGPIVKTGFYEDVLRFEQAGVPANMIVGVQNPYAGDDMSKNQRFQPIRKSSVENRVNKGLYCLQDGIPYMDAAEGCNLCRGCKAKSIYEPFIGGRQGGQESNIMLFIVLTFVSIIVLALIGKSAIKDLKKTIMALQSAIRAQ
jgi:hypothetical protein